MGQAAGPLCLGGVAMLLQSRRRETVRCSAELGQRQGGAMLLWRVV